MTTIISAFDIVDSRQDIETKEASNKYGSGFYAALSRDLRHKLPDADGLSETSVRYAKRFYCLYSPLEKSLPQTVEKSENTNLPQLVENLHTILLSTINWKCSNISKKQTNALTRYSADWTRAMPSRNKVCSTMGKFMMPILSCPT